GQALNHIARSGSRLLYLTARPITFSNKTRQFLATVGHGSGDLDGSRSLPAGALITQTHGALKALQSSHSGFKTKVMSEINAMRALLCVAPSHPSDAGAASLAPAARAIDRQDPKDRQDAVNDRQEPAVANKRIAKDFAVPLHAPG
ncbi:hypothetical protein T484DRAFT_3634122, partial [Baffinella frigidus]